MFKYTHFYLWTSSRLMRCTLDGCRIGHSRLFPHLIHNFHNSNRLLPRHSLALGFPIPDRPCALIRLPVHRPARLVPDLPLPSPALLLCQNNPVLTRLVRRMRNLNLPFRSINPDGRTSGSFTVYIVSDP